MADNPSKSRAVSNVYATLLALAVASVVATAGFVTYMCMTQYETLFQIIEVRR